MGVLAYHLAFDERLTTGLNPALAAACGWSEPEVLGEKEGRPLGMVCGLPEPVRSAWRPQRLREEFGGLEQVTPPAAGPGAAVTRVAVVGAMTDALVRAAHAAGRGTLRDRPVAAARHGGGAGNGHRRGGPSAIAAARNGVCEPWRDWCASGRNSPARELIAVIASPDPLA